MATNTIMPLTVYYAKNRTRKWIRFVGLGVAVMAPFFAAFLFKDSLQGAAIAGFVAHLLGVAAFILSFFFPKLPRLQAVTYNGRAICAGCNTLLAQLKKEEICVSAANGMQYCDLCAKRLEEGSLRNDFRDPVFNRERERLYTCARCKKQIAEQDCVWIGSHRFCKDCAKASERVFPEAERYHEPKPRTEQSSADRTMKPYPPDGTCDPKDREKKCSRCGREMSGFGLTIRDDGYRLCRQCRERFKRFQVFHYSFNPCPQYLEYEELNVYVADTSYLLLLEGAASSAGETFATLPFGSFAKSSAAQIAEKLNSISPGGFGISKRFRLSADEIRNSKGIRELIEYDRSRCSLLHFSGVGYGDHVTLAIQPDSSVLVVCDNFGNGNRFVASGGYSLPMPQDLADNYDQSRFIEWLRAHFWNGEPIEIDLPAEEDVVKRFLSERRDLYRPSEPTNAPPEFPFVEGTVLSFHTDDGKQMTFRLVAGQHDSFPAGSSMGTSRSTWLFFSYVEEAPFLLEYENCSEGFGWFAYPLSEEDVRKIRQGPSKDEQKKNAAFWLWEKIVWAHPKNEDVIRFLHPDDIEAAKGVLYPLQTWRGKLTDEDILGGGPFDRPAPEQEKEADE